MSLSLNMDFQFTTSVGKLWTALTDSRKLAKKNSGKYYIAGPKSMVEAVFKYLLDSHVSKPNIKKDAFFGY